MMERAHLTYELEESERRTIQEATVLRPGGTRNAYVAKQAEFKQWCIHKEYIVGCTVTASKLYFFLEQEVIGRKSRKRLKSGEQRVVGSATVDLYMAAIVDLYQQQVSLKENSNSHPRSDVVTKLFQVVRLGNDCRRKKTNQFGKR